MMDQDGGDLSIGVGDTVRLTLPQKGLGAGAVGLVTRTFGSCTGSTFVDIMHEGREVAGLHLHFVEKVEAAGLVNE